RLTEIMVGYLDPADEVPTAAEVAAAAAAASEDDEATESGPDPEEAKARFGALRKQHEKVEKSIAKHGRYSKQTAKELQALGELFKFFKLTPRVFDPLVAEVRETLAQVRENEKEVMRLCVRVAGMDRKTFIRDFPGSEADPEWLESHLKARKPYAAKLAEVKGDIERAQRRIKQLEQDTDLTTA